MKRIITLFALCLISLSSFSQKSYVNYDRDSKWFFGLNGGATWHSRTEVKNLINGGYGFTFGRSFGMKPEKIFSWDLRFRYLHGFWKGQSTVRYLLNDSSTTNLSNYGNSLQTYQDTAGYFIPNFKTQLISGSIELALNTNRLRQNTGWNFQLFGGIGMKGYMTSADLTDASGNIYDYNSASSLSQTNLLSLQDGEYETDLVGSETNFNWDWMPSFGAGISYQIAPWASIGISHKMTWVRSNSQFDGMPNKVTTGVSTGANDIYHYSSAGIRFHILGKATVIEDKDEDDITNVNNFDNTSDPVVTPTPVKKPVVDIYDPGVNPYTTELSQFIIRADVFNVKNKQNITFKQNGNINNNFTFNAASSQFESTVVLQAGQNIFEITGTNEAGQDYESTIIIQKRDEPVIEPPIVSITQPPYSPYTTANSTFNFSGTVLNVESKSQIKVYLNGTYLPNFTYDASTKAINTTLNLQEGTNTVRVTATNEAGSDSKEAKIIYDKPEEIQPPVVSFINPGINPYHTALPAYNIKTSVLNVSGKSNITVKINGHTSSNFTYNSNTKQINFVTNLNEGANVILVSGTNAAGTDQESITIFYDKPEAPKPPVVTFLDPIVDPLVVYSSSYQVKAKVENVDGLSNIKLKINGHQSYNFAYSSSSEIMSFTTNLSLGSNVIEITGTNDVGQDVEATTIIYKRIQTKTPPVVDITYPAIDNLVFNSPNITLTASVLNVNNASNIEVKVNGNQTYSFNYNTATKILNLPLNLIEGNNTVVVKGTNTAGSDSDTRIVVYKKPVTPSPPTVDFVNPPSSPYLVNSENYTITANTTNIDSKYQIDLFVNGILIPDVAYTFTSNHQIVYNTNLIQGNNVVEVQVTNNDGSASDMAIITYDKPADDCITPTIGYISPVPYSTVNDPNINVDAQINNHSSNTTIELIVNGSSLGYMGYNSNTSIASLAATLTEGSNALEVIASNNCGTNRSTFTLNYQPDEIPCHQPALNAVGSTNINTQDEKIDLIAGVSEITNSNNITVTLNGNNIPFQFDQGTNSIKIDNVNLAIGNNTVFIQVKNDCGSATLTYNIMREKCDLPSISNPSVNNGYTTTNNNLPFTINVSNVTANQVQFIVNGISQAFTYNAQNNTLSSSINLSEGSNEVVINASNACGNTSSSYIFIHEVPCQQISYSLLSPASASSTVTNKNFDIAFHVSGTIDQSGISATHNGQSLSPVLDTVSGEVHLNGLTLIDGSNTITVNLSNDCSNKTFTYSVNYDGCKTPTIELQGVSNGTVVNSASLNFQALITNSNGQGNIQMNVNGSTQSFVFNDQTNLLTANLTLNEGSNTVSLIVNGCERVSESYEIIYSVPCEPITYNMMQPATTNQTVVDANYNITLNLLQVSNQQQITVKLNGNSHPFNFNSGSNVLTVSGITLQEGANTIVIAANNDCSSETITYHIQYDGCQPPVITLGNHPSSVNSPNYPFNATVTNITDQSQLQVLLNNSPASFVYDAQSKQVSSDLTLTEGQNAIKLIANGCETVFESFNVSYTAPCDSIVWAFASPAQAETSVANEDYQISLVAQHVNPTTISTTLNGSTVQHFYSNDMITIPNLTLIDGDNTVEVSMSNDCSSESITYVIHHDGCDAPTIDFSNNQDAVTTDAYNLNVNVENIDNKNKLTLSHNGSPVNFNYNPATGLLTASLSLTEGSNTFVLTANGCASVTGTYSVNYTIPCNPVAYTLGSPSQLSSVVNSETTDISLNVQNITGKSDVSVQLNGASVPFTYNNNVVNISGIQLNEGNNVVVVTITNDCSSETLTYNIESNQCDSPVISVANNNMTTTNPIFTFTCNVQNITNGNNIEVNVNGQVVNSTFDPANSTLNAQMTLQEGPNEITVTANGCTETSVTYTVTYQVPCNQITFNYVNPQNNDTIYQETNSVSLQLNASNVQKSGVSVKLNGNDINFNYLSGAITINSQALITGNNTIVVDMQNACSNAQAIYYIVVGEPCNPPQISFGSLNSTVDSETLQLNATISEISNPSNLVLQLNQQSVPFNYNNGTLSAQLTLNEGANIIMVEAQGCENVTSTYTVTYTPEPEACGPRFNPGNSEWEFCLVTPGGTYNRDDLANNASFTYSGAASAAYFKPIAGGGDAVVNGQAFQLQNGSYYLFEGNLTVDVSSSHPGSMGHWEICIESDNSPASGNGNNRPTSPCEQTNNNNGQGGNNNGGNGNNNNTTGNNTGNNSCIPDVSATFTPDHLSATATSTKDLSNVVLNFHDGKHQKFQGLNGTTGTFSGTGGNTGKCIVGIWIKSGCNSSNDGPGYGEYVENTAYNGNCNSKGRESNDNSQLDNNNQSQIVLQPVFTRIQPSTATTTSSSEDFTLKTKITNVKDNAAIQLYLNGSLLRTGSYNQSNQLYVANLKLKSGTNTIKLVAKNGDKSADISYTVSYNPPLLVPQIKNITPSTNKANSSTATYSFKAEILNVKSKSDISLYLNGNAVTAFTYSSRSKQVNAVLRLKSGLNTVKVIANNGSKKAEQSYSITYEVSKTNVITKPDNSNNTSTNTRKPVITNVTPKSSAVSVKSATYMFKAKVSNVSSKSDIKFYINGKSTSGFTFNSQTKEVVGVLQLNPGLNTIKLVAKNGNESATKSYKITYNKTVEPIKRDTKPKDTNNNNNQEKRTGGETRGSGGESKTINDNTRSTNTKSTNTRNTNSGESKNTNTNTTNGGSRSTREVNKTNTRGGG